MSRSRAEQACDQIRGAIDNRRMGEEILGARDVSVEARDACDALKAALMPLDLYQRVQDALPGRVATLFDRNFPTEQAAPAALVPPAS